MTSTRSGGPSLGPSTTQSTASKAEPQLPKTPQFPPHNAPRVWLLTNGASPISINLARKLLAHGDYLIIAVPPAEVEKEELRAKEFEEFLTKVRTKGQRKKVDQGVSGQALAEHGSRASSVHGLVVGDPAEEENQVVTGAADGTVGDSIGESQAVNMKPWRQRVRVVPLENNSMSQAQSAVAEAVATFGMGIDILLLTMPSTLLGTVEEVAQSVTAQTLVRDEFEANFFANVNLIKAVLPSMRQRNNGHIILLSSVTGHLGTPGLSAHCASIWAMEGYCDSLAYEVAPFNIKTTIVQPNIEVGTLTSKLTSVPPMAEYSPEHNHAPCQREIIASLLDRLEGAVPLEELAAVEKNKDANVEQSNASTMIDDSTRPTEMMDTTHTIVPSEARDVEVGLTTGDLLSSPTVTSLYAPLSPAMQYSLVAETVFAIAAIGGHDNPPVRHIVGHEGVIAVSEKLKTVSEELEDFIEASLAVDVSRDGNEAVI